MRCSPGSEVLLAPPDWYVSWRQHCAVKGAKVARFGANYAAGSPGDQMEPPSPRQSNVRHLTAGTGPAYRGPGELRTFLIRGEETAGAFFMAEISVSPGGGTPPPIHSRGGRIVSPPRKACSRFKWAGIQALHRPAILFIVPAESLIRSHHRRRLGEGRGLNHGGGP